MALVAYSESEESDTETQPAVAKPPSISKPTAFSKFTTATSERQSRKIRVDLPSLKPESEQESVEIRPPPAKRARTGGGAFSGFNSLLPAPKGRIPAKNGLKAGISLRTSGEAAFSRDQTVRDVKVEEAGTTDLKDDGAREKIAVHEAEEAIKAITEEPKIFGKATRFKPLSVANNQKRKNVKKIIPGVSVAKPNENIPPSNSNKPASSSDQSDLQPASAPPPPPPKPKRSLFSMQPDSNDEDAETAQPTLSISDTYEPLTMNPQSPPSNSLSSYPIQESSGTKLQIHSVAQPATLESTAAELNLTASQKRQLFGRHGGAAFAAATSAIDGSGPKVAHFNTDAEYAANEVLRQSGEAVEHRAVKAIAPGKHSLQQLVNNARNQREAMEEKWADGRSQRSEAGGKYGWGS